MSPHGVPGGVRSLFWIAGKGREGQERSGVSLRGLGEVGMPSQGPGGVERLILEGWKGLGVPPGRPGRSRVPPGGP